MVGELAGLLVVLVTVCVVAGMAAGVAADVVAGSCVRAFLAGCLGSDLFMYKSGLWVEGIGVVRCVWGSTLLTEAGNMPQSATLKTFHGGIGGYVHVVASPRVREGYSTQGCDVL